MTMADGLAGHPSATAEADVTAAASGSAARARSVAGVVMTSRAARVFVLLPVILVTGVALAFLSAPAPTASDPSSCLAGPGCATGLAASAPAEDGGATTPCLHSANCGGGGLLTGGGVAVPAVLGAAIVLVMPSRGVRRAPASDLGRDGRLAAARLFRPPRPSF
jgi:hypothetical protein